MTNEKTIVTEEGLKKLQEEYDYLVHTVRDEVTEELKAARAQGDLSENADYDAARDRQAQVEARIRDLDSMLSNYELIVTKPGTSKNVVRIGSTVTITFMDTNKTATYTIVGSTESDPLNGKLSNVTPLAEAILERKAGSVVTVNVDKPYKVTIESIK